MVDARVLRTRKRLQSAVLQLASETPIEVLGIEEVCQLSGVSRATFYRHASSPAEVLQQLMHGLFDPQHEDFIAQATGHGLDLQGVHRALISRLANHVAEFADVYALSLPHTHSVLRPVLLTHLYNSTLGYVHSRQDEIELLGHPDSPEREFRLEALARNYALGELGIIEAWCASRSRSLAGLEELMLALAPGWNLALMRL